MPAKKKNKYSLNKKESKRIKTRLIEISLRVEDLIYHKRPLSISEAELFIKEVTSYKLECSTDERSLQVIEKLVRCMKAIITEQQETRSDDCNTGYEIFHQDDGAASPVYSLPDEDRKHMTQELLTPPSVNVMNSNKIANNHNNNLENKEFFRAKQMYTVTGNDNVYKNVNHCNDNDSPITVIEDTEGVAMPDSRTDFEIHKALSNLSLQNVDEKNTTSADIEYSQSILNNFDELHTLHQNNKSNVKTDFPETGKGINIINTDEQRNSQEQAIKLLNTTPVVQRKTVTASIVPSYTVTATENVNNASIVTYPTLPNDSNLNNTHNFSKTSENIIITSTQFFPHKILNNTVLTNVVNEERKKYTPNNETSSPNKYSKTYDSFERFNSSSTCKKYLDVQINVQENTANMHSSTIVKKKRGPRKNKATKITKKSKTNSLAEKQLNRDSSLAIIQTKTRRARSKEKITGTRSKKMNTRCDSHKNLIPIYNKRIENDLSWLENIRFVREIREDEYIHNLTNLNEHFWDNYYLPPNFDDTDFL